MSPLITRTQLQLSLVLFKSISLHSQTHTQRVSINGSQHHIKSSLLWNPTKLSRININSKSRQLLHLTVKDLHHLQYLLFPFIEIVLRNQIFSALLHQLSPSLQTILKLILLGHANQQSKITLNQLQFSPYLSSIH